MLKLGRSPRAGVGRERELRHQQHAAGRRAHVEIHFSVRVREHAIGQQPRRHRACACRVVTALHAEQHQQPRTDRADCGAIHGDLGTRDALDQCSHRLKFMNAAQPARTRPAISCVARTSASVMPGSAAE
jgi:hypothetical protein